MTDELRPGDLVEVVAGRWEYKRGTVVAVNEHRVIVRLNYRYPRSGTFERSMRRDVLRRVPGYEFGRMTAEHAADLLTQFAADDGPFNASAVAAAARRVAAG